MNSTYKYKEGSVEITSTVDTIKDVIIKVVTRRDAHSKEVIGVQSDAMELKDHLNGKRWKI